MQQAKGFVLQRALVHNAAQKAAEAFRDVCGIDIEECYVNHSLLPVWQQYKIKGVAPSVFNFLWYCIQGFYQAHQCSMAVTPKCCRENFIHVWCQQLVFLIRNDKSKVHKAKKIIIWRSDVWDSVPFFQAVIPMFTTFNLFLRDDPQIDIL